jgi:hypothetical protein
MIPFIMNCATVVATTLIFTQIDTTFSDRNIPLSEIKLENAVEVINCFVIIIFFLRTVCVKFLSRISYALYPEMSIA